jgi:hypothetical protein
MSALDVPDVQHLRPGQGGRFGYDVGCDVGERLHNMGQLMTEGTRIIGRHLESTRRGEDGSVVDLEIVSIIESIAHELSHRHDSRGKSEDG